METWKLFYLQVHVYRLTFLTKHKGGGLAVSVNNRWCNPGNITIKDRICSPDIELLAKGLRLYFLPREFLYAIVVAAYIPLSANPMLACDVIHSSIAGL